MNDQLQIDMAIPPQQALWRLSSAIEEERVDPKIGIALSKRPRFVGTKEFIGKIEGNVFRVREETFYRNRTAVGANWIRILNFYVNAFGEWRSGSEEHVKSPESRDVPRIP